MFRRLLACALVLAAVPAAAQQPIDSAYTAKIRELTPTDSVWKFATDLVDYLPASETVPTPLAVLGYVPGTVGRLSYVADINRYFKAVADASPRAQLFSLGTSDEGREMVLLAIADEETMGRLDEYRTMLGRLADPRGLSAEERDRLVRNAKPIYWLTGSIHSPETGSPEMLMELAYRLAVDESDHVRAIRDNVITLITPVLEVDGRDRVVDVYKLTKSLQLPRGGVGLAYWGKYTAHDNNRDGMVLSQTLTQNYIKGFLHWKPVVGHDLHESVPFLYTSTGTGPYNDEFDPIVIDEWYQLAYQEINELTRRGLPGVWTHGFYDGWAPNYVLAIANLHNSIGRFYETYTSSGADCHTVDLRSSQTDKEWYRPNPPVNGVTWVHPEQHQLPGVGRPRGAALRRRQPGDVPEELRRQGRADGGEGADRGPVRVRHPAGPAARRRGCRPRRPVPPAGRGGAHRGQGVHPRREARREGQGGRGGDHRAPGRLDRADGPAVHADGPHAARDPALRAGRPPPVRRHGLDARRAAARGDDRGRRPHRARSADDAPRRGRGGTRRRLRPRLDPARAAPR